MKPSTLHTLHNDAIRFLRSRQTHGRPFGHFNLCAHAFADDEVSALCVALELWKMLGLPLATSDLAHAHNRLRDMQHPDSGLIIDPSWRGRLSDEGAYMLRSGDSFFTRSAVCALAAWGLHLGHPAAYLHPLSPEQLLPCVCWTRGGHAPFALGDLAVLLRHNRALGLPGADRLHDAFLDAVAARQDPATGLWLAGDPASALTPSINFTFHTIKFTCNARDRPLPHAEQAIDSCLAACRDERFYSWETGYACNDLDLALVLYSAAFDTNHRRDDIRDWARERLPLILDIQKSDGGFSFYHDRAMDQHCHLAVSPGEPESDLWGTLMYLGTIRMMVRLGYPDLHIPWGVANVHFVRT